MHLKTIVIAIHTSLVVGSILDYDLIRRATCNADNCARAVTGTFRGSATKSARLADCTKTLSTCTVTPTTEYPFTVYLTTNGALPPTPTAVTNCPTPSALPQYASACRGASAYSSACSCGGASAATTTLPAPSVDNEPFYTYVQVTCTAPSPAIQTGAAQCGCRYQTGCGFYDCSTRNFASFGEDEDSCRDFCDNDPDCAAYIYDPGRAGQCQYCSNKGGVLPDSGERIYGYRISCPSDSGCNPYNNDDSKR